MYARELSIAKRLAELASDEAISYAPVVAIPCYRADGLVWYPVLATASDGRSWPYLLRAEWGSYAGIFPFPADASPRPSDWAQVTWLR